MEKKAGFENEKETSDLAGKCELGTQIWQCS